MVVVVLKLGIPADSEGRIKRQAFLMMVSTENRPIILGRDHHDVSGTDSPYRETSNIYDGSQLLRQI